MLIAGNQPPLGFWLQTKFLASIVARGKSRCQESGFRIPDSESKRECWRFRLSSFGFWLLTPDFWLLTSDSCCSSPFRELEPFAGAFLAVLLAFLDAGVAG